jgi:hypothetical protein
MGYIEFIVGFFALAMALMWVGEKFLLNQPKGGEKKNERIRYTKMP